MELRSLFLAGCVLALTACTSIEGTYLPSCVAFSGSEIRLADGRFHWSKFTDQVVIDEDGNEVDPFPGFPLEGVYKVSGEVMTLAPDSGESPQTLYVQRDGQAIYLLDAEEKAALESGRVRPPCALQRQVPGTSN
jgi:hypothetical protein